MKVKDLLTDETKWCRDQLAMDDEGNYVDPTSPRACRWCALGAAMRVKGLSCSSATMSAVQRLQNHIEDLIAEREPHAFRAVGRWNDAPERTLQDVLDLMESCDL